MDYFLQAPDGEVYVSGDNSERARLVASGYVEVDRPDSYAGPDTSDAEPPVEEQRPAPKRAAKPPKPESADTAG